MADIKKDNREIFDAAPDGWIRLEGAANAPKGCAWYSNGQSRFSQDYGSVLARETKRREK